ncbi:MAG: flagellar hook-associated protein FlgK [Trichlorobacter sp.]|jgi:flagellar hook-associated protein 1 FlgK
MGISAAFEIGKSGLKLFQVAAEVTSENIANVNTPGYSRQRVVLQTAPPTTHNGFPLGTGVRVQTVERYYDSLLQKQLVNAGATSSYNSTKAEVLQQIEPVFNEIAQEGIGAAITKFFNSWQDLSLNPTGQAERQAVLSRAQILTDQFHYVSRTLNDAIIQQEEAVVPQVNEINRVVKDIALLNGNIKITELVDGNANEMRDQRDYLIRQLSEQMGVKFTENDDGTTDVYVTDAATGTDYYLVNGSQFGTVNAAGTPAVVTLTDYLGVTSNPLDPTSATPFYSSDTAGGQLWATLKMRDVTIPDYLTQVDALAFAIAGEVNTQHAAGFDIAGNPGGAFFTGSTAASIGLDPAIDFNAIAASGSAISTGDNSNAVALAQLLNDATTMGTSTFSNYYNSLVAQVGLDVQTANTVVKQDEAFMKQLTTLRDSQSGVSLDEELANLIQYQRSYQASAKLITTATEMMDVVLAMV